MTPVITGYKAVITTQPLSVGPEGPIAVPMQEKRERRKRREELEARALTHKAALESFLS